MSADHCESLRAIVAGCHGANGLCRLNVSEFGDTVNCILIIAKKTHTHAQQKKKNHWKLFAALTKRCVAKEPR